MNGCCTHEGDVKTSRPRYLVRLVGLDGRVRRVRLSRLWAFLWIDGRYWDHRRGTRTYRERSL